MRLWERWRALILLASVAGAGAALAFGWGLLRHRAQEVRLSSPQAAAAGGAPESKADKSGTSFPLDDAAQQGTPASADLCGAPWVQRLREAAGAAGKRFALVRDASFRDHGWSYSAGITYTLQDQSLTMQIFGSRSGEPRPIYSEKIDILDPETIRPDEEIADTCPAPDFGPYFNATIVDLEGDGTKEIVVKSNNMGGCSECLSSVSVYKVSDGAVQEALSEDWMDINYAEGKGLTVDSFVRDDAGTITPTHKTFFMPAGTPTAPH